MRKIIFLIFPIVFAGCNDGNSVEDEILIPKEIILSSKWKSMIYSYDGKNYEEMFLTFAYHTGDTLWIMEDQILDFNGGQLLKHTVEVDYEKTTPDLPTPGNYTYRSDFIDEITDTYFTTKRDNMFFKFEYEVLDKNTIRIFGIYALRYDGLTLGNKNIFFNGIQAEPNKTYLMNVTFTKMP